MTMSQSVLQKQYNLVQDFVDLLLPPNYPFSVEKDYPRNPGIDCLAKDRIHSLEPPDTRLIRLDQLSEESDLEQLSSKVGDWTTIFIYSVLDGFGHRSASKLDSTSFDGLRELATTFGLFLGHELQRFFTRYKVFRDLGSFCFDSVISLFSQLPAKELGEAIRESITPAYLRAGESVRYELALLDGNQTQLRESLTILEASDAQLEREIANMFSGYSREELGKTMQTMVTQACSKLAELFDNDELAKRLVAGLPHAFRWLSWYVGRRLYLNLQYDPQRTTKLLGAVHRHKEIPAAFELYRYNYGWQGDRDKAVLLS